MAFAVIQLNMSEALDRFLRPHILSRVSPLNNNLLQSWISLYLTRRPQVLPITGTKSNPKTINGSVIHGKAYDPLLFLLYINFAPISTSHGTPFLFADDKNSLHS